MKWDLLFIVVSAVLLVVMVSDALPAVRSHDFFATEPVCEPPTTYVLHYMPMPNWWPH